MFVKNEFNVYDSDSSYVLINVDAIVKIMRSLKNPFGYLVKLISGEEIEISDSVYKKIIEHTGLS